jgi:hypothetical protein
MTDSYIDERRRHQLKKMEIYPPERPYGYIFRKAS